MYIIYCDLRQKNYARDDGISAETGTFTWTTVVQCFGYILSVICATLSQIAKGQQTGPAYRLVRIADHNTTHDCVTKRL